MENIIQKVELGEDLKGFIKTNYEDINFENENIYDKINNFKDTDFVLVKKQIASPTKILEVKLVDEDLIAEYV